MAERIQFDGLTEWARWALVAMVAEHGEGHPDDPVPFEPGGGITVEVRVNGTEVSFSDAMARLAAAHEDFVAAAADAMLSERMADIQQILDDALVTARTRLRVGGRPRTNGGKDDRQGD